MSKITEFTRPVCRALNEDVRKALQSVADKHGLKLDEKGASFRAYECSVGFKFVIDKQNSSGVTMNKEAQDFLRYAALPFGALSEFTEDDLGAVFHSSGDQFKIVGYKSRAKKYPILAERVSDGKRYKFTAAMVQQGLGRGRGRHTG